MNVIFFPVLEFSCYVLVLSLYFFIFSMPIFPNNWYHNFWFNPMMRIWILSMLCGCKIVWSSILEKKGGTMKLLRSMLAWENWWKNRCWLVKFSSQVCVPTIRITQEVDLYMYIDWHWYKVCCEIMSLVEELSTNKEAAT